MKVLAVIGSPHFDGPGARLTMQAVRGAKDAGHEVTVYRVNEMDIRGCQGCNACKNASIDCVLKDDLAPYWKALHEADALIVSAPNYAANVCGPMITYMNRHYCLLDRDWRPRIHPGIRLIGIFTQGDADRDSSVLGEVGRAAARQIRFLLQDAQVLAISGGRTIAAVAQALSVAAPMDVTVVPASGGMGGGVSTQANTLAEQIGRKLGGAHRLLHLPDGVSGEAAPELCALPQVREVLELLRHADVLLYSCLLYTSPSPRDLGGSRMPSSA